jgi:hypothetical protein
MDVVAEMIRERRDDGYWVVVAITGGSRRGEVGPFETREEADRALEGLKQMSLSLGGIEVPGGRAN